LRRDNNEKNIFFNSILSFFANAIFAISLSQDYFIIFNLTNTDIIINFETAVEPALSGVMKWHFYTEIGDIPVNAGYENSQTKTLAPDEKVNCIYYSPHGSWLTRFENDYYNRLRQIPIMEKLNRIFKSFTISDVDGNVLLTLSDIEEEDFTIKQNSDLYIILPVYKSKRKG
jgi:hypothetical protein